jgi:hypothetical protein
VYFWLGLGRDLAESWWLAVKPAARQLAELEHVAGGAVGEVQLDVCCALCLMVGACLMERAQVQCWLVRAMLGWVEAS